MNKGANKKDKILIFFPNKCKFNKPIFEAFFLKQKTKQQQQQQQQQTRNNKNWRRALPTVKGHFAI